MVQTCRCRRNPRDISQDQDEHSMKTLAIFRHAKSDWNDARLRDFDRPLNSRGRKGAEKMGAYIRSQNLRFDRVLASPAVRVTQTIEISAQAAGGTPPVVWDRRVYLASSDTLQDVLRSQEGDPGSIILVGHNPGLEDLILDLVPDNGTYPLRDVVEEKFPTAAFAVLDLDIEAWSDVREGCAALRVLTLPRDLDPDLGPQLRDDF
jgi:phosphohistidine phosphatase